MHRLTMFALVLFTMSPAAGTAAVIHVPGDQPTIQAGIDAAVAGDTVRVADGIWTGPDNRNLDFGGTSITVISENGPEGCIIDCEDSGRGFHFHGGEDVSAVVHGFTIQNGLIDGPGAGILISGGAAPVISGCILTGNDAGYYGYGGAVSASGGLIRDCIIHNNQGDFGGGLTLSGSAITHNCLITNNYAHEGGGGLFTGTSGNPAVSHCTITNNISGEGGGGVYVGSLIMTNCIVWDNWAAVLGGDGYVWGYGSHTFSYSYSDLAGDWYIEDDSVLDPGDGLFAADPLFTAGPQGSWYLSQTAAGQPTDSPCLDTGDPVSPLFGTTRTDLEPDSGVVDVGYHSLLDPGMYICHDPAYYYYNLNIGDPPPADRTLEIWSCVEGTVNWTVTSKADWLTLDPMSGSSTGEVDVVTVSVDPSSLAAGTERAEIVISAPEALNSPVTIPVTLVLDGPFAYWGYVAGPGPSPENPPLIRVYDGWGSPVLRHEFTAYGASGYGVRVACGDPDGDGAEEIITGAGPGAIYGPHVRGFEPDGTPLPGLNFMAYGTLKYGVNPACGDLDGDGFDEIVTGAGPGAVFGPHVRGFRYHQSAVTPLAGVSFFAYGTLKFGVNVCCGDLDGDGMNEIVTGAGPGPVFGPHVRGWNVDGGTAAPMAGVSFMAYNSNHWGVNVACGDLDGDGLAEILTAPGPGPALGAHIRGWNADGSQVTPVPGCELFAWPPGQRFYGARVAVVPGGRPVETVLVGGGPDPSAGSEMQVYLYDTDSEQLELQFSFDTFDGTLWGADVAGGGLE